MGFIKEQSRGNINPGIKVNSLLTLCMYFYRQSLPCKIISLRVFDTVLMISFLFYIITMIFLKKFSTLFDRFFWKISGLTEDV